MRYYVVGAPVQLFKPKRFLNPFSGGLEIITENHVLDALKSAYAANKALIVFTDLEKAQKFAKYVIQDAKQPNSPQITESPPIVEVTLKNDNEIFSNDQPVLSTKDKNYRVWNEKYIKLANIESIYQFFYYQGKYSSINGITYSLLSPFTVETNETTRWQCAIQ